MEQLPTAPSSPPDVAHVLIVEDDIVVRDFCVRLLRIKGYAVTAAEHGRAALAQLETHSFDLVVTDLQMPQMGGIELLKSIRKRGYDLDIIIFTAYATIETARDALKFGAFDYLTKPVSVDDLERTVRRAIEWRRAQREKQRLTEIVAVYEISQAFTRTLDTQLAVHEIVTLLSRHFAPESLSLSLLHADDQQLELLANVDPHQSSQVQRSIALAGSSNEVQILAAHRTLCASTTEHTQSHLVALVLRSGDHPIGVLQLSRAADQPGFDERERTLLTICASQIAASLDNSRLYRQQKQQYLQTILAFAAVIDARDPYTRGHSEAVMHYAVQLAEGLGLDQAQIELIRYGALLHDIGKIGVRDQILQKPGRLTDEEMEDMKAHPRIGANILRHIQSLRPVIPMVEYHHERMDGRGYPQQLAGEQIPREARILAIADSFDAMTSERAYRKAMPIEQAMAELQRGRGSQWDATFVDVFLQIIEHIGPAIIRKY
jgi:putative nucleotidyltransferase with HDIG domain